MPGDGEGLGVEGEEQGEGQEKPLAQEEEAPGDGEGNGAVLAGDDHVFSLLGTLGLGHDLGHLNALGEGG
jgi:hypothetical protein